jgi:hypothetical protein
VGPPGTGWLLGRLTCLIIQTIRQVPSGSVWIDEASNLSTQIRLEPTSSTQSTRRRSWRCQVPQVAVTSASRRVRKSFSAALVARESAVR